VEDVEEFKADGRARSIGVSNFQVAHLQHLAQETDTVPAVDQIELHPYFQNSEVDAYDRAHGIAMEAWAPIAQGNVLDDPALKEISDRLGKSVAQVVLRWHIEHGNIVFPQVGRPRADRGELPVVRPRAPARRRREDRRARQGRSGPRWPEPDVFDYLPSLSLSLLDAEEIAA
jgi:2,5-diketo-D-gluconate reductase A